VRECRVIPVYSLLLVCVLPLQSAHETAGALGIRHSPRPPRAETKCSASDASRREGEVICETLSPSLSYPKLYQRHCEEPLRRSNPWPQQKKKDGLLRVARNVVEGCRGPFRASDRRRPFLAMAKRGAHSRDQFTRHDGPPATRRKLPCANPTIVGQ